MPWPPIRRWPRTRGTSARTYIACEALGLGTVAIGSYHQETADALLGLDGTDEFVIYAAPVGRVHA